MSPDRYFRPPYVGSRGWLGMRLDQAPDGEELAAICLEAYRTVAPKRLAALLYELSTPPVKAASHRLPRSITAVAP